MMAYPYNSYQNPWQQGYYPVYQQPQVQPIQQSYTPPVNQNGIIWISGEQEAAMFPIAPNNAVALWSKDGKTIYLKSADATGKPTMRIYDLVERSQNASDGSSAADSKLPAYAMKDDLVAVAGAVKGLANDIEQIKTDVYGIAGKKKIVRKQEVAEDAE